MDAAVIVDFCIKLVCLLIAVIGHEIMHGAVALKYGDMSAKYEGRLTLNPIKHIDLFGSIIIPGILLLMQSPFLIGYAKPVPVDIDTVHRNGGFKACFLVAMAGIFYNFIMAILAIAISKILIEYGLISGDSIYNYFFISLVFINIVIALFNLIPIPPLDGSKSIAYVGLMLGNSSIARFFSSIERYGMIIIIALLFIPVTGSYFSYFVRLVVVTLYRIF